MLVYTCYIHYRWKCSEILSFHSVISYQNFTQYTQVKWLQIVCFHLASMCTVIPVISPKVIYLSSTREIPNYTIVYTY